MKALSIRQPHASLITGVPGDYEWHLSNIRPVKPVPIKGKLGLFDVDITDLKISRKKEKGY